MPELLAGTSRPLGAGRFYPAGSLRDSELAARLASYKAHIAGAYASIAPDAIHATVPPGRHIVSTKVDGEQWFLYKNGRGSVLLSPNGKAITGVPLTEQADQALGTWSGLLAGELYAEENACRSRVFDLHAALGGGVDASLDRLRFAAFDLLRDEGADCSQAPFLQRVERLRGLLAPDGAVHSADFTDVDGPAEVDAFFQSRVQVGAEGIVLRCADGRVFKIKPSVTIDAAVVAWTETSSGLGELLLGLMPDEQTTGAHALQLIGRVDMGSSQQERHELAERLRAMSCVSLMSLSSRSGLPYTWVRPEMVVEVTCHELLAVNTDGESIRRWRVSYGENGWQPTGKAASVSLRDAVFVRVREDKTAQLPDVRWSQVGDLVPVHDANVSLTDLPGSTIVRREVYAKSVRGGLAVRKFVAWKTNKEDKDPRYPAYAVLFTDYSPARDEPLRRELRVASNLQRIMAIADAWLAENIRRGWDCLSKVCDAACAVPSEEQPVHSARRGMHTLTIAFARSASPTFPIVRRRLDALAELGKLHVTKKDSGAEVWFELEVRNGLVENHRRIANLLNLVRRWKSTEISLDGETLDKFAVDSVVNRLDEVRQCWNHRKAGGAAGCRRDCALGCRALRITASQRFLEGAFITEPAWYAVGRFEGGRVALDKAAIAAQVERRTNGLLEECPLYDKAAVLAAIESLPTTLSPDEPGYRLVYRREDGIAAWVWPEHASVPPRLAERGARADAESTDSVFAPALARQGSMPVTAHRQIPAATYGDVCGQEAAVEAVRDLIELPMKHAALFEAVGASAKPSGVILAGPPGTGKTLLARAVAGECGAHLEIVSGPELLNPYVGATEKALRDVFDRARHNLPALVLFDELDGLAPSRASADAHHERSVVAQLLALLDGLETRNGITVLATTNRPEAIDPALRRPGRFDRVVWMKAPDKHGRAAILTHYLKPLRLAPGLDVAELAASLASATTGASGADLEHICLTAARVCVKETVGLGREVEPAIREKHFRQALQECGSFRCDEIETQTFAHGGGRSLQRV